MSERQKNVTSY